MTLRVELAAALHHSAGPETNDAVRSQKKASSRDALQPGVLEDPGPQLGVEHAACPSSTGHSPLPGLGSGGEVHDATLVVFLVRQSLLQRKKVEREEEERKKVELEKKGEEEEELRMLSKVPMNQFTPTEEAVSSGCPVDPRRDSPPAQGGMQMLGVGPGPQIQVQIVDKVVDVPVNTQAKLQQSLPIDSGLCLRCSSSTECWTFLRSSTRS